MAGSWVKPREPGSWPLGSASRSCSPKNSMCMEGTEWFLARNLPAERLGETAGQLPVGVKTPKMTPLTSSTMDLLKIGLVSTALGPMELRTLADWVLKPRLLAVPGVAKCSVFGGGVRQLQIPVQSG